MLWLALNLGELLLDEHFGLYEAMSAVEMMDPKMDAGMMCNRSDKPTLTFEKGVEVCSVKSTQEPLVLQSVYFDSYLPNFFNSFIFTFIM